MDKKLKIAIGTDAFPPTTDGTSGVAQNYADQIHRKHGEAVVITPKNPNKQDYNYSYPVFRYKSWWIPSKEGYSVGWPFKDELHQKVIDMNFDLLHSHTPLATSYYFRRVVEKKKIPVVLTYHTKYEYDLDMRIPVKSARDFAYRFILNNINSADEVWITSKGTVDSLRKLGYKGDYVVMPNGCDFSKELISQKDAVLIRQRHNIPDNIPVFIYSGRMIWYKNIQLILDSCRTLKEKGVDFRLIMLGFGAEEVAIKRYSKKIGLADKTIWTGQILDRNEVKRYYGASDLLLFPSVFDTNGLVVREAAACATPSLLIKDSCASEGITDCETGFLCSESADSIACSVEKILQNNDLLKRVGKNAQDKIYISWEDAVNQAFERYKIVIDNYNSKSK